MRKHNVKEIHLKIDEVQPFENERFAGFNIYWSSDIGFGVYGICKEAHSKEEKWYADSETMDSNENKEFITELMRLFIEKLIIE